MAEGYAGRTLREIIRIIAGRFIGMSILFVIVVGATVIASLYTPKWYRAEVQLMASPGRQISPLEEKATSMREQISLFVTTQREIIRSDTVLATALYMLDHPEVAPKKTARESNGNAHKLNLEDEAKIKAVRSEIRNMITTDSKRLREFRERVSVVTPGGPDATFSQTFAISVDWPENRGKSDYFGRNKETQKQGAETCQKLAEYLAFAYLNRYTELQTERAAQTSKFLAGRIGKSKAYTDMDKARKDLQDFAEKNGDALVAISAILGETGIDSGISAQITRLQAKISQDDALLTEKKKLRDALDTQLNKQDDSLIAAPDEVVRANIAVNLLQQKVTELRQEINGLTPQFTEAYPEVRIRRESLAGCYKSLRDELVKQKERVQASIDILQASHDRSVEQLEKFSGLMKTLGAEAIEYDHLMKRYKSATTNYEEEEKEYLEAVRAEQLAKTPILVSVLDDVSRPNWEDPRRPIMWLNVLIGCMAGLVLSLIYAFMADHFDHTIKSVDDAEKYLEVPVLMSLPKISGRILRRR